MNEEIKKIIEENAPMRLEQIIKQWLNDWLDSHEYRWMLTGERYYRNKTDILSRKRLVIGGDGELVEDKNLANNKLVYGFTRKLVDQKIGYLLSKQMSIQSENEAYQKVLNDIFDKSMHRTLKNLGKEAVNKGIAWLHVYYDENGTLSFKRMRSEEMVPVWIDEDHTQLQAMIRRYKVETYEGTSKKEVVKVEWWDDKGVRRYIYNGDLLPDFGCDEDGQSIILDSSHYVVERNGEEQPLNWERVPFIAFKANDEEQPLIELIKSLVDDYDKRSSDNSNNLEDLPNSVYKLKDYGDQDLGLFRKNLMAYRAVKVDDQGDVDTIDLKIDNEAFKQHIDLLRKAIYEFGRGVDMQTEKFNGATGIALKQLYNDLDMDANTMETEFQASLEQLLWFINNHLANTGVGDFEGEKVEFVFNRDILLSESDVITDAMNSMGLISNKTIIANHPWVSDPRKEEEQIKKEKEASLIQYRELEGGEGDDPVKGNDEED
ncbi:phage portal protein [Paenibacillus apis]|uniref:Portal protein n=1 Tax=Paenibacillus apis TaxID=1792174 RepID=A0A919Y5A4_9BACL|nr:phage portal protein [Paenibacillus apis]GIO42485.1 portal protein [Paenibacillus apis]